jgi:hypothetical protein
MTLPFPFKPDWTTPITERLSWLTAIQTSRSGAEQRQRLRLTPRRTFDIPVQLVGQERSYFDILLAQNGGGNWNVPIPHEEIGVGAVFAGQSIFYINVALREISIGSKLLVRGNCFQAEVVYVTAVGPDSIVTTPTVLAYQVATLTPTFEGVISEKVSVSRPTARIYTATVRFTSLQPNWWPITERALAPLPAFTVAGKTFPILTQPPNAVNSLDYDYERMWSVVDNDVAVPVYIDKAARQFTSQKYEFFLVGPYERQTFRDLLYTLHGRQSPIWVPTYNDDMSITQGYPNPYGLPHTTIPGREAFVTFNRDGRISSHATFAFDGQPGEQFSNATIAQNAFVTLKRLDVDDVEIQHYAGLDGPATVSVIFREAPDLRVPASYAAQPFPDALYHHAAPPPEVPTNDIESGDPTLAGLIADQVVEV